MSSETGFLTFFAVIAAYLVFHPVISLWIARRRFRGRPKISLEEWFRRYYPQVKVDEGEAVMAIAEAYVHALGLSVSQIKPDDLTLWYCRPTLFAFAGTNDDWESLNSEISEWIVSKIGNADAVHGFDFDWTTFDSVFRSYQRFRNYARAGCS